MTDIDPCEVSLLTPAGRGAVATVLVDGPRAADAVGQFLMLHSGETLDRTPVGRIVVGVWRYGNDKAAEEVVACRRSPQRMEIHCHGGRAAAAAMIESLCDAGCRQIPWQDVVRRDETDPLAAEARILLARARTERAAGILLDQYDGALREAIEQVIDRLKSDDRTTAHELLRELLQYADLGLHLVEPWRVVLVGKANVGKSSLINALVGYRRAIVFPTPGTTRDVVTATTAIDGLAVELADTAGLSQSGDDVERLGVEKARRQAAAADLVLGVFDASGPWTDQDDAMHQEMPDAVIVHHKCDLVESIGPDRPAGLATSAVTCEGLDRLLETVGRRLAPVSPPSGAAVPFLPELVQTLREAEAFCYSDSSGRMCPSLSRFVAR